MTEPAKSILTVHHPKLRGGFSIDEFVEGEIERKGDPGFYDDPHHRAVALWESIKNDWPGALHSIADNEEAIRLMMNSRMRNMGFTDDEYKD